MAEGKQQSNRPARLCSCKDGPGAPSSESVLYSRSEGHEPARLRDGMTRPFTDYRACDPFVLRDFSEELHRIVQKEIGIDGRVFHRQQRFDKVLRDPLEENIFGGFHRRTNVAGHQSRLVLSNRGFRSLPYLVWSSGQREFVPLLLGLHLLVPTSRESRRDSLEWVVIVEPETGFHPDGIGQFWIF